MNVYVKYMHAPVRQGKKRSQSDFTFQCRLSGKSEELKHTQEPSYGFCSAADSQLLDGAAAMQTPTQSTPRAARSTAWEPAGAAGEPAQLPWAAPAATQQSCLNSHHEMVSMPHAHKQGEALPDLPRSTEVEYGSGKCEFCLSYR